MKHVFSGMLACIVIGMIGMLTACGSGSQSAAPATTGRATFVVQWPQELRTIPFVSNSVRIVLRQGDQEIATKSVTWPANRITFDALPPTTLTAVATAHPGTDGSGTINMQAMTPIHVQKGQEASMVLALNTGVTNLTMNMEAVRGQSCQLLATPRDTDGCVVLLRSGALCWASSDPSIATVDENGCVQMLKAGTVTIKVTETNSGMSSAMPFISAR